MTEAAISEVPETTLLRWDAPGGEVRVHAFADRESACAYTADIMAGALQGAIASRGQAMWLGCGGTTPRPAYEALTRFDLDWSRVTLVQLDERYVPVDDPRSNTRMMAEALDAVLTPVDARGAMSFISLMQPAADAADTARAAEERLYGLGEGEAPVFDFALMGMGPDAHYASIFPNHPIAEAAYDTGALVLPVEAAGDPVVPRLTLTVPALNRCRRIVFLITGQTKLDVLRQASLDTDRNRSPIGAFLAQCPAPVDFVWAA